METTEDTGFSIADAIAEAGRCLHCQRPLCREGCPIENDIPAFNYALAQGNIGQAREIIAQRSNLPAICGRVCPHETQCEGHCVLSKKGNPIRIGKIERFIADFDAEMHLTHIRASRKNRGTVAVVGSGPAGLTVAGDLAREGFNVVVYEGEREPGGVLLYGIPEFRLPKSVVRREVSTIAATGVTYITNCMVGVDLTLEQLFERGFDAVFIGTGTALAKSLDLPGAELAGIVQSNYLLRMVRLFSDGNVGREEVPVAEGEAVVVVGAGNVAMDAARTAVMLKARSVTVAYRKTIAHMSASKAEYESTVSDGVRFLWETEPLSFEGRGALVTGLKVRGPSGEAVLPADKVLLAIGSRPAARIISTTPGIDVDSAGYVITKERPYGMTTRKGVFAGGDVVHKPATVVLAMKEAKKVAAGIASYVDAKKLLEE
ncbi:Glutamate synthase (NADPH) [Treponema brennaborense DSM 12168]|uniref:Glutamate synthase (NADPH) n=2 Tax=Treponema TaxID=157 RepID=F4LIV8_TREBD|nr:Glutamate synthase (NADPH) [Treponema brennaborense DSM 12168]